MTRLRKALCGAALGAGLLAAAGPSSAAGFFTNDLPPAGGTQYPSTLPLTGSETLPADTQLTQGQNPASESIATGQLNGILPAGSPRNYLLNGDMLINQQGTTSIVGGTTTITALQFSADRWFIDTNVTSGTGKSTVKTTTPAPPPQFTQEISFFRNSAALLQPVCMIQEIETSRATMLAGQYVVLSAYLQGLANALTTSASVVNAYVIYGTGTDQGIATLTASPAITPAWTNITGGTTAAASWQTTSSWVRFYTAPVLIPTLVAASAVTEVGVELCFTPSTETAGATDGIAMTGVQLEPVLYNPSTQNTPPAPGPSPYEFRPLQAELADAERYFYQVNEPASGAALPWVGMAESSSVQILTVPLPVQMRGTTPVVVIPTTGTFKEMLTATATTWVTPTAGTCSTIACQILTANTSTIGYGIVVQGGGSSGVVYVKHDVVF